MNWWQWIDWAVNSAVERVFWPGGGGGGVHFDDTEAFDDLGGGGAPGGRGGEVHLDDTDTSAWEACDDLGGGCRHVCTYGRG